MSFEYSWDFSNEAELEDDLMNVDIEKCVSEQEVEQSE